MPQDLTEWLLLDHVTAWCRMALYHNQNQRWWNIWRHIGTLDNGSPTMGETFTYKEGPTKGGPITYTVRVMLYLKLGANEENIIQCQILIDIFQVGCFPRSISPFPMKHICIQYVKKKKRENDPQIKDNGFFIMNIIYDELICWLYT